MERAQAQGIDAADMAKLAMAALVQFDPASGEALDEAGMRFLESNGVNGPDGRARRARSASGGARRRLRYGFGAQSASQSAIGGVRGRVPPARDLSAPLPHTARGRIQ